MKVLVLVGNDHGIARAQRDILLHVFASNLGPVF